MEKAAQHPQTYLYRRIVQSKLYIDNHFSEHIDLNRISGEAAFSKYHFIRLFKKIYRLTPHRYLRKVRLDQAKLSISRNNDISIEEVCLNVGFESVGTFSTLFKKEFGVTPGKYRESMQNRKTNMLRRPLAYVPGCFASANNWT